MEKYTINDKTLALVPITNKKTKIYEKDNVIIVNRSSKRIIEESCVMYGENFQNRKIHTENLTGMSYKSPISIGDKNNLVFFPTKSPRLKGCCWISLDNLDTYHPYNDDGQIFFKNNLSLYVNTSSHIIENQILKSYRLDAILKNEKDKEKNNNI